MEPPLEIASVQEPYGECYQLLGNYVSIQCGILGFFISALWSSPVSGDCQCGIEYWESGRWRIRTALTRD